MIPEKFDQLYHFLNLNGIKANQTKDQALAVTQCPNCKKSTDIYPLALCDFSNFDGIDMSYKRINISDANVYSICLDCFEKFKSENDSFTFFYTEPKEYKDYFLSLANAHFFFGVQILKKEPLHQGIITRDIFIFSEEESAFEAIKEKPEFMAGHYFVYSKLLENKVKKLESLKKTEVVKYKNILYLVSFILVYFIIERIL